MSPDGLQLHAKRGRDLLRLGDGQESQSQFMDWDEEVASWLDEKYPGSGVSAQWSSLALPRLNIEHRSLPRAQLVTEYREAVQERLAWLGRLARDQAGSGKPDGNTLPPARNDKVFVVHGRDNGARETVARYLERLHLKPVILHEQPNEGRTIIEKFVDCADVGFAVVLATGDDLGGLRTDPPKGFRVRPRQNVVLELGFFFGKLGRNRVCVLVEEGIEIPSDYSGVLYLPLSPEGSWHVKLAKEMKKAGLPIDMNDL